MREEKCFPPIALPFILYSMAGIRIPKWKRIQTKQLVCLSARRQGSFYCTPVRLQCNCKGGIAYCTFANKLYKKLSKKVSFKVQCLEIDFMRADFGALAPPRSPRGSRAWRHEQRSSCWPPQFPPLCTPSKNVFWMKQSLSVGKKKSSSGNLAAHRNFNKKNKVAFKFW